MLMSPPPRVQNPSPPPPHSRPQGCAIDMGGYFWNILMAVGAATIQIAAGYGQYRYGEEMRAKAAKAAKEAKEAKEAALAERQVK